MVSWWPSFTAYEWITLAVLILGVLVALFREQIINWLSNLRNRTRSTVTNFVLFVIQVIQKVKQWSCRAYLCICDCGVKHAVREERRNFREILRTHTNNLVSNAGLDEYLDKHSIEGDELRGLVMKERVQAVQELYKLIYEDDRLMSPKSET